MRILDCGCSAHGPVPEGIVPGFRNPDCDIHNFRHRNARFGGRQTIHLRRSTDGYAYEFIRDGLKVNHVPTDSDYYGYLYAGDVITGVDSAPYERGMITPLRKKVMDGQIDSINLSVRRVGWGRLLTFGLVASRFQTMIPS